MRAARGADLRPYPWGFTWDKSRYSYYSYGEHRIGQVGRHPQGASPFGAEDMLGNAFEWTKDSIRERGLGWRLFGVVKGGEPGPDFRLQTVWEQGEDGPAGGYADVGFRCVRHTAPGKVAP